MQSIQILQGPSAYLKATFWPLLQCLPCISLAKFFLYQWVASPMLYIIIVNLSIYSDFEPAPNQAFLLHLAVNHCIYVFHFKVIFDVFICDCVSYSSYNVSLYVAIYYILKMLLQLPSQKQ